MYIMYWELHLDCPVLLFLTLLTRSNNQFENFNFVQVFFNKNNLIVKNFLEPAMFCHLAVLI